MILEIVYKNGLIAELMGRIKPTVQAYISGPTVKTPHCPNIQIKAKGTQQKKSVKTIDDIFNAIRSSFLLAVLCTIFQDFVAI